MSVNSVTIGSGNGLSPIQRQAITRTNADSSSIGPLKTRRSEIRIKQQNFFIHENALESVVCEMAAILSVGAKLTQFILVLRHQCLSTRYFVS